MKHLLTLAIVVTALAAPVGLYSLEQEVAEQERRLAELNRELLREQQTIHVLKAEWSHLTRPGRLQQLAERHSDRLALAPVKPEQIVMLADVPGRAEASPETPAVPEVLGQNGLQAGHWAPVPMSKPSLPEGVTLATTGRRQ